MVRVGDNRPTREIIARELRPEQRAVRVQCKGSESAQPNKRVPAVAVDVAGGQRPAKMQRRLYVVCGKTP